LPSPKFNPAFIETFLDIGMEMALSVRELNGLTPAHKERLQILEEAKNYPVIDGDGYSLNARIDDLKAQIKGLG